MNQVLVCIRKEITFTYNMVFHKIYIYFEKLVARRMSLNDVEFSKQLQNDI